MDYGVSRRDTAVGRFSEVCREVLTEPERRGLYKILNDYYKRRRVERLITGLFKVIREENRMEVIHVLRRLIPFAHLQEFDRQTRQKKARGQLKTFFWEEEDDGIGTTLSFSSESESEEGDWERGEIRDVTLLRDGTTQGLGFSIRGGSEHALGVYVSEVIPDSPADRGGLEVGDRILAVDGVSLKDKPSSIVGSLLTRGPQVTMTLKWTGHLPKWRLVKEKTAWFDNERKTVVCGDFEKCGSVHYIKGLDMDVPERRVTLVNDGVLGLNIRGGSEFGLGIYVSGLDPGGQAESQGLKVGDQIVDVNGVNFDDVTHAKAIEVLTGQDHIIMTLRDVGRYPAFKEVYGKYSWTKGNLRSGTRKNTGLHVKVPVEVLSQRSRDTLSDQAVNGGLPLQSEIYLPSASRGSSKEKNSIHTDSDVDELEFVNLEMWKHSEGFQNPAFSPDIRKNGYTSSNYDDESDTDDGSGVKGEYSMDLSRVGVEEFELTDMRNKQVTLMETNDETRFQKTSSPKNDDAIHIVNPSSRHIVMTGVHREEMMYVSERSHGSDTCSLNLSFSPETRRYTAWSDDDDEKSNNSGDGETVSPASTRRSRREDSDWGSEVNSPELTKKYNVHNMSPSPISSIILPNVINHESHTEDEAEVEEVMEGAHASPNHQYASVNRQESTGFIVYDEEDVVMRSFDRQISDLEERHCSLENEKNSPKNESNYFLMQDDPIESSERSILHGETHSYPNAKSKRHSVSFGSVDENDKETKEDDDVDFGQTQHTDRHTDGGTSPMTEISGSPRVPQFSAKASSKDSTSKSRALGNWKILRDKVKGSLRIKPLSRKGLEERLKEVSNEQDQSGRSVVSSTKFHKTTLSSNSIRTLEEAAKRFLDSGELSSMLTQIRKYHESHDLDRLLEVLLAMLDTPEKILLLREIRSVIYPVDIYRFELSVSRYETEAYEKLSTKLHLYLNHEKDKKPKKHLLYTETDEHGHFYVKSVEQFSREQEMKRTVVEALSGARDNYRQTDTFPGDRQTGTSPGDRQTDTPWGDSGLGSRTASTLEDARSDIGSLASFDTSTRKTITANISKNKQNLGLCVSGGIESRVQPEIKVEQVIEGGAAADEPAIQPGLVILSIDGLSMVGVRHTVAVDALRSSFSNKRRVNMTVVLQSPDTS